ncbi:hypothetical protein PIROE2DRAFT_10902 [Piromyces sp. E2]|nr:hypothetical protein PIROE2DRAFT_10902 [Piromyces sp. E2]|eukprot:OUM62742.1 hypothetical protein PIROE2DRAFT_10902 [Piromyces sp. E2]
MKSFLLLINIIFIFSLTLVNAINVNNSTVSTNDCQIYYSIIGTNDGSCEKNEYNPASFSSAIHKNGRITEMHIKAAKIKSISPSIAELSELEKLELYYMPITELPNEFFQLKKLKELIQLEKIPPSIGELSELEKLNIEQNERNEIKEIPNELFKLKKLREL